MRKFATLSALLPALTLAGQVFAQAVPSLADGTFAMGEAVEAAPAPTPAVAQEDVTSEIIGDWDLQCAATGPEPRPCRMYQLMRDDAGTPISEITLFGLPSEESGAVAGATVIVPLETLLSAQITLSVDGQDAKRYPFAFCNQAGCIARLGLNTQDVETFKGGNTALLQIVPALAPTQVVNVKMSLNGFTKAYNKATGAVAEE